jgi:hypothetical protein
MRVELRPTVAADLPHVIDIPLPHRIRAITAVAGDQILGVGGIGYRPDGTVIGFVAMKDEMRRYPLAIHRAGLMGMAMIRDAGAPRVIAEAQENNPAAEPWMLRLGFRKCGDVFVWEQAAHVE